MAALVKIRRRGRVTLPVIDRSKFPAADGEYTPEQRRIIDARLTESTKDIRAGRLHGPFETHDEMVQFLRHHARKARGKVSTQPRAR